MSKRILIALGFLMAALSVRAQPTTDTGYLLEAYTQFVLAQQVQVQAVQLAAPLAEGDAKQVTDEAAKWMNKQSEQLRASLDEHFGDAARERFAKFVAAYTTAEGDNDLHYLGRLSSEALLGETPMEFSAMRSLVLEKWLQTPFEEGSRLLGEMQTWAEIRALSPKTPPLNAWLNRELATTSAEQPTPPPAPATPSNPLMAAEAPAPEWTAPATPPAANPMDAFSQSRSAERDRALMDAQTGMQQMAMERQAAETEYSAKKLAAAQADADAMRAQALKMAAVEQEAIDQRANSWSGRLKKIVSATVGAATGAFTAGIGTEAGRQAADALFPR